MPNPNPKPDREAIKTLAIAVGVREAARQLGLNENTVMAWSRREQWFKIDPTPQPPSTTIQPHALHAKPGNALLYKLQEQSGRTKIGLSRAALKAARTLAKMPGESLVRSSTASSALQWAGTAEKVHGWRQEAGEGKGIMPGLAIYSQNTLVNLPGRATE